MNLERFVEDAYERWRKACGFFVINGIIAYVLFVVLAVAAALVTGVDPSNPTDAGAHMLALFSIIYTFALLLKHVYLIMAAYVGREGKYSVSAVWRALKKGFVGVGITTLLIILALVTGGLLAELLAMLSLSGVFVADIFGLISFLFFIYVALRFSLAPYYAVKLRWDEAVAQSLKKTREHFISVLLIEAFFVLLIAFLMAVNVALYVLVDAFFLAHIVNMTLFNLVEARR